ncbi:MAG: DNA alkylation repair protein [Saprospiraceae bacterium]|nr:DNA alkylation repair protein [Bacteroidia bacterium]NNL93602.1 DNA alkylation repair protein [Saprospiraceae bacterium]
MKLSKKAQSIYNEIKSADTKLGDLRKIAKEIKKDHDLAMELWSTGEFIPQQLSILIMDKKCLTQDVIDQLDKDMMKLDFDERNQLADWLMANQLTKDKKTLALVTSWENSKSDIQRRIYWYYQARLRWMGKVFPETSDKLLSTIEKNIVKEEASVQWAMNFTAAQIGVFEEKHRPRCIALGEKTGLYKDEIVPKGCTPSYLPEFIKIQVAKIKK